MRSSKNKALQQILRSRFNSNCSAFTVIEVLVVLFMISFLLTLSLPFWTNHHERRRQQEAQRQLHTALRMAQAKAQNIGHDCALVYVPSLNNLQGVQWSQKIEQQYCLRAYKIVIKNNQTWKTLQDWIFLPQGIFYHWQGLDDKDWISLNFPLDHSSTQISLPAVIFSASTGLAALNSQGEFQNISCWLSSAQSAHFDTQDLIVVQGRSLITKIVDRHSIT